MGSDTLTYLSLLQTYLVSVNAFLFGVTTSGITLFVELNRDELSSMCGDRREMYPCVVELGFPGAVARCVPILSMFTVLCPN